MATRSFEMETKESVPPTAAAAAAASSAGRGGTGRKLQIALPPLVLSASSPVASPSAARLPPADFRSVRSTTHPPPAPSSPGSALGSFVKTEICPAPGAPPVRVPKDIVLKVILMQRVMRGFLTRKRYRKQRRFRFILRHLLTYLVFWLMTMLYAAYLKHGESEYFFVDGLRDLVIGEEFPPETTHVFKNFHDVASVDEFWEFLEGPFLFNMFPDSCYGRNESERRLCQGLISNDHNMIVRGIRLRQFRAKARSPGSCPGDIFFPTAPAPSSNAGNHASEEQEDAHRCSSEETVLVKDVLFPSTANVATEWVDERTGIALNVSADIPSVAQECFRYDHSTESGLYTTIFTHYWSSHVFFNTGGFLCDMMVSDDKTELQTMLATMKSHNWVSRATRAVMVEFSVYNSHINRFCVVRLAFEFPAVGGVTRYHQFDPVMLYPDMEPGGEAIGFLTVLILLYLMVFGYIIGEFVELYDVGIRRYCHDPWNLYDILNIVLFIVGFAFSIPGLYIDPELQALLNDSKNTSRDKTADLFVPLNKISHGHQISTWFLAVNLILVTLKLLKYMSASDRMNLLLKTVFSSLKKFFFVLVILFFLIFGYAMAFYLTFGARVSTVRSMERSILFCVFGIFDGLEVAEEMVAVEPFVARFLLVTYAIFTGMYLFGIILTIIDDTWSEKKATTEHIQRIRPDPLYDAVMSSKAAFRRTLFRRTISARHRLNSATGEVTKTNRNAKRHSSTNDGPSEATLKRRRQLKRRMSKSTALRLSKDKRRVKMRWLQGISSSSIELEGDEHAANDADQHLHDKVGMIHKTLSRHVSGLDDKVASLDDKLRSILDHLLHTNTTSTAVAAPHRVSTEIAV